MNILVTGSNGQLGRTMRLVACESAHNYIFSDITELPGNDTVILDVTDIEAVTSVVDSYNVDIIVNCSGYTDVDRAEVDYMNCEKLNTKAPEILAKVMKENGGFLIHMSTDYVFGGESYNTPRREEQLGTPTGVYGLTKLRGEEALQTVGGSYVIIRTAWLHSEFGKNFVKTMLNLTSAKPEINVVFDQTGTPTYAMDLARTISVIIDDYASFIMKVGVVGKKEVYPKSGIYHYSNEGVCSWYDFARMIAEYSGNTSCNIKPCHSDEFPSKVKRPSYSVLDKTKIKETFGLIIPYWTDSLKKCISNL